MGVSDKNLRGRLVDRKYISVSDSFSFVLQTLRAAVGKRPESYVNIPRVKMDLFFF